ncbi:DUF368 domain-containing protein [uncultured Dubosiella sp.]|uniref:DUF368 domain-containing protein n=1 Tax=uncultured Dubosiella sp. TaxID=1937011 RepID=UPI0025B40980|nr:DUF368 domain-containing protein [uncultured Dubosiella sp.]
MIKEILEGIIIGIANIIPGVSGGTMMVAMGIYDKLIESITHLASQFKKSMRFLIPIFIGIGIAIVALSRLFEFLLGTYPIPTNLAFCGLILGGLPFITAKVKNKGFNLSMAIPCLLFFVLVIAMAVVSETSGLRADLSFGVVNVVLLFLVGVVAAATMVIPGVSGSMMLMCLGYYEPILSTINTTIDSLIHFDLGGLLQCFGVLIPFGLGIVVGVFAIAKLVEWLFARFEVQTYWAIIGLVVASPIAILLNTDWSTFTIIQLLVGILTFALGWFAASKLGEK